MKTRNVTAVIAATLLLSGCGAPQSEAPEQQRPQQAVQPIDPLRTASHIAGARLSAITGDQAGVQRNMQAFSGDLRRAMKLADASRPIEREAARGIARAMTGVRSANWIDRHNLLVRVDGAQWRSQRTIDDLCIQLEPLGDTLAVVVHLQNGRAIDHEEMDTLSRNCQLPPGDQSMFHAARTVDVLDPAIRAQHRANGEAVRRGGAREQIAGDRAAIEAMAEM